MMKKVLKTSWSHTMTFNSKKSILILLLLFTVNLFQAQIVINEVKESGSVELKNLGTTTVDVSTYWLCDFPSYTQLSNTSITVISGNLNLTSGAIVEISGFDFIDSADGELGLYNTSSFGSTTAIEDYIQWGSGNHQRASVAASGGVWSSASDFIPAFDASLSLQYDGTGDTPLDYTEATDTLGAENETMTCDANSGDLSINTTGLNDTTTVATNGLSAVICVDSQDDFLSVTVGAGSVGTNAGYIITDASTNQILGLPTSGPFNLNGAGIGTCEIWYVRYESDFAGNIVGNYLADLTGCFDLSNSVQVIREAADGGTVAIDLTATGNPNSTTSFNGDTEAVICVDSLADPLVITHSNPLATNLSYRYVITNEDSSEILAISASATLDLNGAGVGTCKIWGWSYRGMADNGASFIGGTLAALQAEECSDISDNAVTVIREAADGGTVAIDLTATDLAGGTTVINDSNNATINTGDGIANPIVITHSNPLAENLSYRYVITDASTNNILNIVNTDTIDLEGVFAGTCQIWGWSYRGLADNGASFIGGPLANLQAIDCSDISDNTITITRDSTLSVDDFENTIEFKVYPNPTTNFINIKNGSNQSFNANITLYDLSGRVVYKNDTNLNNTVQINVSSFQSGVYLLNINNKNSNTTVTRRVIKR